MRVVVGSDASVTSPVFTDADEIPTSADVVPTVMVTDHTGTSLPEPTVTEVEDGTYSAALTRASHTGSLDVLTLTWSATVSGLSTVVTEQVEVVGGYYASVPSIRSMPGMEDVTRYPTERIREVREEFERLTDTYRGTSFVPRLKVEPVAHTWWSTSSFILNELHPRTLRSITVGTNAVEDLSPWLMTPYGLLYSDTAYVSLTLNKPVSISYEYGYDAPPPAIQRACREYVRAVLLKETSGVDRDIIWQSFDSGVTNRYSTPDWNAGRPTGWLEVDRLLNSVLDERVPVCA